MFARTALALALTCGAAVAQMATVDRARLLAASDLRFVGQVERSEAGLPLGNGRHGTLLWTEPDRLRMQVNRVDVFARDGSITEGEEADWAGACAFVDVVLGDGALPTETVVQHLSVHGATATVIGPEVELRAFAWRDRDLFLIEIDDRRPDAPAVEVELRMIRPPTFTNRDLVARSTLEVDEARLALTQHFEALEHDCRSAVAISGLPDVRTRRVSEAAARLTFPPGPGRRTVVVSSAASLDEPADPLPAARALLDEGLAAGFDVAHVDHRRSWSEFWRRSFVHATSEDGDADLLQEYWAYVLYIMGSSSRGRLPVKFNGMIWSTEGDARRWGSLYWWWNTQLLYRPMLAANHPELLRPMLDMYGGMLERAKTSARQQWGAEGAFYSETTSFDGPEELPEDLAAELREYLYGRLAYEDTSEEFQAFSSARNGYDSRWNWTHKRSTAPWSWVTHILFSGAQIAWHHWLYHAYTGDDAWLRERGYPLIREVAELYRTFPGMRRGEDGLIHLHDVNDQELLWGTRDPHTELWAARGVIAAAIGAAELLGVDEELRPRWRAFADALAPPPLSTDPDLVEGCFFPHPSGRPVWALGRTPVRHVEGFDSDNLVRPCIDWDLWTIESDDAAMTRIAHDTYEAEPMRLRALAGQHAYALSETPLTAAALGRAEDVRALLPGHLRRGLLPNRLSLEDGHQAQSIEPIATVASATQLALLQSVPPHPGGRPVVRLFPAWPAGWDATFELAARGGLRVASQIRADEVRFVELTAGRAGAFLVRSPWGGAPVDVHRRDGSVEMREGGLLEVELARGESVRMVPAGADLAERRVAVP